MSRRARVVRRARRAAVTALVTSGVVSSGVAATASPNAAAPPTRTFVTAPAPTAPTAHPATVTLLGVTPAVATPGSDVTVTVRVTNPTRRPATPTVRAETGGRLVGRSQLAEHASSPRRGRVVATTTLRGLGAGASTTATLTIPADSLRLPRPFGVLPLTIHVTGLPHPTPLGTFLPYQVAKEYEPLRVAVALPLTADPDPALLTATGRRRTTALADTLGPGSRADRITEAADRADTTLVADPLLLTPPHPGTTATPTPTPSGPSTSTDPRVALARRATGARSVWLLPPGDPDLSALHASGLTDLIPHPDTEHGPHVTWPAGAADTAVRTTSADTPAHVTILRESRTDPDPDVTGTAHRTDPTGRPVLVSDDVLSTLTAQATRPDTAPALSQRALAETATILAESPGRRRSLLLLPDRGANPDPTALTAVVSTLRDAPWVTPVTADDLLTAPDRTPVAEPSTPPRAPASPLTRENAGLVRQTVRTATGLRDVLAPGAISDDTVPTLLSTRWRGHGDTWNTATTDLTDRLTDLRRGVHVVPSTVNFFAEHGALQVTVVNDLDVDVHDLRLTADTRGNPRLRILDTPDPITIRARSRATVRIKVEAVAAGVVPVTVALRTPHGTPLGQDTAVRVRVRPTSGWIVLAAGGVVGVVFLLGLFRAIRAGERRVAAQDLRGLDLD